MKTRVLIRSGPKPYAAFSQSHASDKIVLQLARWLQRYSIIIKSVDPLNAKKTFIRKKLGHKAVSAIKASSVTL